MKTYAEQLALEAAYYVTNGESRDDACEHVKNLEEKRNDPEYQIQTGDNSDTLMYIDSALNEPKVPDTPQIRAIAKDLIGNFTK